MLRADHVVVVVLGELHVEAVGGFGGLSPWPMSSGRMRKYLVMSKGWPGPKRTLEKMGFRRVWRVAAGAVEEEDGVVDVAGGVAVRGAEGEVVEIELGEGFAGAELEVLGDVELVLDRPF